MSASVSLIVCSRERPGLLLEAVASVLAGERVPEELVVVDQSEEPNEALARMGSVRGCRVRYVRSASRGLSRARNEAVRLARHSLLVFTDDDVRVTAGWLGALVDALERAGPGAVATGRVLPDAEAARRGFVPTLKACDRPATYAGRLAFDPLVTFNMALRREELEEVGGFDERLGPGTPFPAGEDNELAFRMLAAGRRIVLVPEAVLHHRAWRAAGEYASLRRGYGRGQGAFLAKHLGPFTLRRLAGTVLRNAARAPLRLFSRRREPGRELPARTLALGDLAFAAGTVSGALEWLRRHGVERGDPKLHPLPGGSPEGGSP